MRPSLSLNVTVAGTIKSSSGGFTYPDGTTQTTAGVTSVSAIGPLSSSGGSSPAISLSGTVATGNGGTGITTAPSGAGQFLRSSGANTWAVSTLQAGDVPAGSTSYIQNGTSQQASASFNIAGSGTLGGTLTVTGTGTSTVAGSLGVGTSSPQSLLQVGGPGTSYGSYLQIPLITNSAAPPVTDCNTTSFGGRMVLEYKPGTTPVTTLWACSGAGKWVAIR